VQLNIFNPINYQVNPWFMLLSFIKSVGAEVINCMLHGYAPQSELNVSFESCPDKTFFNGITILAELGLLPSTR
jgi:hypothetical protein